MKRTWKAQLLLASFGLAIALAVAFVSVQAVQSPQVPLAGSAIPQFVQPLPVLDVAGGPMKTADGTGALRIHMCEFDANVLPLGTLAVGVQTTTRVWGYIAEKPSVAWAGCPTTPQDTYIGPVVLATKDVGTKVTWINDLGDTSQNPLAPLFWNYSTDQTLDWADPVAFGVNNCMTIGGIPAFGSLCSSNYTGPVPAVPHLHGGEVPPELDGGPDAWFTTSGLKGHAFYTSQVPADLSAVGTNEAIYNYPNTQEASPIWFHDHALGITRLNVYAGLAGAYLIKDDALTLPPGLHPYGLTNGGVFEPTVPIVVQDRMFDTTGQLFFPADTAGGLLWSVNPEHPYWVPEFLGDTIVVNGKAWPFFNVEPKRYRFLFLNGSNARTYEMFLVDPITKVMGPSISVIATDGGYLQTPVTIDPNAAANNVLTMMPGERYEVIIDFSTVAPGTNLILRNNARSPYPKGAAPNGQTTGRIMQFRVGPCTSGQCGALDTSFNPTPGATIRGNQPLVRLVNPATGTLAAGVTVAKTRQLTLNEVMQMPQTVPDPVTGVTTAYPGGPLEILVNNTKLSGESPRLYGDFTPITVGNNVTLYSEIPTEGETELWEIVNLTADAHPMHLHLVQFQIMNRQSFNTNSYPAAYALAFPGDGTAKCPVGVFCPGFGPPLSYNPSAATGNKWGGNPDVGAMGKNGKPVYLQGPIMPPKPWEAGWKDTIMVPPGQVTRIVVRWAPTSLSTTTAAAGLFFPFDPSNFNGHGYVWHCHIIDHEDNEMMRPDLVMRNPAAPGPADRPKVLTIHY